MPDLWLGGGQSEPYSCTCIPKKQTSTPSTSSNANKAFVLYGKDSAISPLSTNLWKGIQAEKEAMIKVYMGGILNYKSQTNEASRQEYKSQNEY